MYTRPNHLNASPKGKQPADLSDMLRRKSPCNFCISSNHCVYACDKRKAIIKKMFMSLEIENKKRKTQSKKKACE